MDGQCCTLNYYEGEINVTGAVISDKITSQATKNNPC